MIDFVFVTDISSEFPARRVTDWLKGVQVENTGEAEAHPASGASTGRLRGIRNHLSEYIIFND